MKTEKTISLRGSDIPKEHLPKIAEQIVDEYERRKKRRKPLEDRWAEVDRQVDIKPDLSHKRDVSGKMDENKKWLPETELPLQSQTLEQLCADSRRSLFPKGREWFAARAALTNDYIEKFMAAETPIARERGRFDGSIVQDEADQIAKSALHHYHRQYNFRGHVDLINAESYSYGFGVGRLVPVTKRILGHTMKGRDRFRKIPMLIPRSAKNVYLDDSQHAVMHEGVVIGPNTLLRRCVKLADMKAAAKDDPNYHLDQLARLTTNKDGEIELVELEGDLVYDTSDTTNIIRDVKITAARGLEQGNVTFGIIHTDTVEENSYLVFPYQLEAVPDRYGSAPLLKGSPVNRIAAQLMNRTLESGALKNDPPLGYPNDDPEFAATGGPQVHPGATWPSTEEIQVYSEIGGDPAVFMNAFMAMRAMYYDVSGVNPGRLGAETKSHTTAYAKDVEVTQGGSRSNDYVTDSLEGPLTRFLEMEYRWATKNWRKDIVYCAAWREFLEISKAHLPDIVSFDAYGAGAPAEELAEQERQMRAIQTALQIDMMAIQMGRESRIDHAKLIERTLTQGGVHDASDLLVEETAPAGDNVPGQIPGIGFESPVPEAP